MHSLLEERWELDLIHIAYWVEATFTVAVAPLLLAESSGDSSAATFLAAFSAIRYRYF